jgi:RNA polymerase sigma-32 factor
MLSHRQSLQQPMLTQEEELELIARWRTSRDESAKDRLICTHMRICYAVAARYDNNEEHIKDLAQEGVFGLMVAIEKFDETRGVRFAAYAKWWVMNEVAKNSSTVATVIDIPPRLYLGARGGGFDDESIPWEARQAARGGVPLDAPISDDSEATVIETLQDKRPDPEEASLELNRLEVFKTSVDKALATAMNEREAIVLRRRALSETPDTLEEISADLNVSRERVRQIEAAAIGKLRKYLISSGFPRSLLS